MTETVMNYREELKSTLTKAGIAAVIGFIYGYTTGNASEMVDGIVYAILFSGIPEGWKMTGKIVPPVLIGTGFFMFVVYVIRAIASAIGGFVILAYKIVKCIVGMKGEDNHV